MQRPVLHHRDSIRQHQRLSLIVGDINHNCTHAPVDGGNFRAELQAHGSVEVGQWFVKKKNPRLPNQRAAQRDTLAFAAGERRRFSFQKRREIQHFRRAVHPALNLVLRKPPQHQPESEIFKHGQVRQQRVILKNHRNVAVARRHARQWPPVEGNAPRIRRFQTGDHPQRGRFAATGRSHDDQKLAIFYSQVEL